MIPRILHLLSQRPGYTGSGVTLDSTVRLAEIAGWDQQVIVGTPADDPLPDVGGIDTERIHPVLFEQGRLDFPVPGMSDVMPYPSTRFSMMHPEQLRHYRQAFRTRIGALIKAFRPHIIHSHHLWLMSSLVKTMAPRTPQLIQCHATGLRQLQLCPYLAREVRTGCSRANAFLALCETDARNLMRAVGTSPRRIVISGSGYREDLFHARGRPDNPGTRLIYSGKYSNAKGLPQLLDAVERLAPSIPGLELHVAGQGSGPEAESLAARMKAMPQVVLHGQLEQQKLAELMRRSAVCVLPSFFEGIPCALVEGMASGCRLVATDLPGIREKILPLSPDGIELVTPPRLIGADSPLAEDLPAFVERLTDALRAALSKPSPTVADLYELTGQSAYLRTQEVWLRLIG